jgi:hypothetical protein
MPEHLRHRERLTDFDRSFRMKELPLALKGGA